MRRGIPAGRHGARRHQLRDAQGTGRRCAAGSTLSPWPGYRQISITTYPAHWISASWASWRRWWAVPPKKRGTHCFVYPLSTGGPAWRGVRICFGRLRRRQRGGKDEKIANARTLVMCLIETAEGIDNVEKNTRRFTRAIHGYVMLGRKIFCYVVYFVRWSCSLPRSRLDRHRGGGHPPTPATPPCVRVRTRRFELVTLTVLEQ